MTKSSPADATPHRRRLDLDLEPLDVLRTFRGRDRLVALMGAWHQGEALIAFEPSRVLDGDPFDGIDLAPTSARDGFGGGWIGAWGYQLGGLIERLPPTPPRPIEQPDHRIAFYDHVLRLTDGAWFLEWLPGVEPRADAIEADLASAAHSARPFSTGSFEMTPSPDEHRGVVQATIDHIAAGDIFQSNVCVRLEAEFDGDPLDAFCAGVEALQPAYAAFISSPEGALASMSPELFLRRTGDEVLTSPIKGTAALDTDVDELIGSAKDRAENIMIVDLMRNDLGRVSVPGSVRVPATVRAERHAVWHLVSDVVAHLGHDVLDSTLLRATFPPGSVTGAPKVRAMEIIHELEATGREAYTGAIGHVSAAAGLELNVAIRTFEFANGRVWLGVGGGIVADSTPDGEYAECLVKARPLIEAIGGRLDYSAETPSAIPASVMPAAVDIGAADESLGVYDTLLIEDGVVRDAEAHLARLDASVRSVYGTTIRAGLDAAVHRRAAGLMGRHRLRVDAIPASGDVTVTMTLSEMGPQESLTWTLTPLTVRGGLGPHKWADRSVLGFPGATDHDLLLLDEDGSVLETGRASLFVVHDDGVHTPPLNGRILPGTARARIIEILRDASVPVLQRRLTLDDLRTANEVLVANSLRGVVPVTGCEEVGSWPVGRTTSWLRDELWQFWRGTRDEQERPASSASTQASVLFIDNYDSFVYNLVQYVGELGATTRVVRNDAVDVAELVTARERGEFTHIIVSPGPGTPADAGVSKEVIRRLGPTTPILGVCLGHQAMGEVYGASVVRADEIVHGKPSLVHHEGAGVFAGLPSPVTCARYHSLVIDPATVPDKLEITARTASGVIMGVRHREHPVEGVQMHPESILTSHGHAMLQNFLAQLR